VRADTGSVAASAAGESVEHGGLASTASISTVEFSASRRRKAAVAAPRTRAWRHGCFRKEAQRHRQSTAKGGQFHPAIEFGEAVKVRRRIHRSRGQKG